MITLERYTQLKQRIEEEQREADRAQGALQEVLKRLQKDHDCRSIKLAKKKLMLMRQTEQQKRKIVEIEIERLEKDYAQQLSPQSGSASR